MTKTLVAAAVLAALLSGCGGGSSSSSSSTPVVTTPPPVVRTTAPQVGYFGYYNTMANDVKDHVDYVLILDWGDWDIAQDWIAGNILAQISESKANGINKYIISVGFLTWYTNYTVKDTALANLTAYKKQLMDQGVYDQIVALYPMDEPDLYMKTHGLTEASLEQGLTLIKQVFPDKDLMVIYGDNGTPAQSFFKFVGRDRYGNGVVTIPLLTGQMRVLIIGGADPWRELPDSVVDYALAHGEVEYLMWFVWGDYSTFKGIHNNGMEPTYRTASQRARRNGGS